jgi:hypothetical protein
VIVYWIIKTTLQKVENVPYKNLTSINDEQDIIEEDEQFIYGNRLMGFVPCSDSFGVDLILENYQKDMMRK